MEGLKRPADAGARHWGALAVDPAEPSLPGLKAAFLLSQLPAQGAVLDIGCGEGKFLGTAALAHPALRLGGCDIQRPTAKPQGWRFSLIKGRRLPAANASQDAALLFDVLEHVPDPAQTLDEAARVLKPGGRLIVFVPVEGQPLSAYALARWVLGRDVFVRTKEHIQSYTHAGLHALLERRFRLERAAYAYHPLGQSLDAAFFAAQVLKPLARFWWKDNAYYHGPQAGGGLLSRALNVGMKGANALAWAESRALARVRFGSAGLLASLTKR